MDWTLTKKTDVLSMIGVSIVSDKENKEVKVDTTPYFNVGEALKIFCRGLDVYGILGNTQSSVFSSFHQAINQNTFETATMVTVAQGQSSPPIITISGSALKH